MKTTIKAIISVLLLLSMAVAPAAAEGEEYSSLNEFALELNGDVNGDGVTDNLDAAQILKYDASMITDFENPGYTATLTPELEESICRQFWSSLGFPYSFEDSLIAIEKYYGNFNGYEVVDIDSPHIYDNLGSTTYALAGYMFYFQDSREIYVVIDGKFKPLSIAYKEEYLDDDDIFAIAVQKGTVPENLWTPIISSHPFEYMVKSKVGDANKDGKVNSLDAAWILKYDAGLVE